MKLFQYTFFIPALLLCLCFSQLSTAATKIEGLIKKQGNQLYIQILPERLTIPLTVSIAEDRLAIERLEDGDHIFGQGKISSNQVRLDTLYYVGLKKLLGVWQTLNWDLFEFKSFQDLAYWSFETTKGPISITELSYTLAPTTSGHWSMLMVDKDSVEIGRLEFRNNLIHLEIVNQKDGSITRSFSLTPVALTDSSR